jgi:hypothetical protein
VIFLAQRRVLPRHFVRIEFASGAAHQISDATIILNRALKKPALNKHPRRRLADPERWYFPVANTRTMAGHVSGQRGCPAMSVCRPGNSPSR